MHMADRYATLSDKIMNMDFVSFHLNILIMITYENERLAAKSLINKLLANKDKLPYTNIANEKYLGWVTDFKLKDSRNNKICLDLNNENDLFLLFILAIVWSRTGIWENSAYFVSYLKIYDKDSCKFWIDKTNCLEEERIRQESAENIFSLLKYHTKPRKKISFRKDIFQSINILAQNWHRILKKLEYSEEKQNFTIFMRYLRSIEGLGVGNKKILIKIPLILRELRCQNIYQNISGSLCCVVDNRVFEAGESIGIFLEKPTDLNKLIKSSTKIYSLFGDLYDLPLFAYKDLEMVK